MDAFADDVPALPLRRVGAYEVVTLLGRGATASVYDCRHVSLGRHAAVKVLHPHLARDEIAAARFLREGRSLSSIVHPGVVEVLEVGEHDGLPYIVMPLVAGEDLGQFLRTRHPLPIERIVDCLLPAIAGVAAAHDAGIIHRDLKPSNIRLTRGRDGALAAKVLDFGLSKDSSQEDLTETHGVLGTAAYMSPEQLRSPKQVDARSDIYALGVVLYECVTGVRPFRGDCAYDLMHAALTAPVAPPSSHRPDVQPAVDAIILRAMNRVPSARFASARELGRALSAFASDPSAWRGDFDEASERWALAPAPGPVEAEPSEVSVTLVSHSGVEGRRTGRAARMVTVGAACGLIACVLAIASHWPQSPTASAESPRTLPPVRVPPTPAAQVALPPAKGGGQAVAATLLPTVAGEPIHDRTPRTAPAGSVHRSGATDAPPEKHGAHGEEVGTNGALILE